MKQIFLNTKNRQELLNNMYFRNYLVDKFIIILDDNVKDVTLEHLMSLVGELSKSQIGMFSEQTITEENN